MDQEAGGKFSEQRELQIYKEMLMYPVKWYILKEISYYLWIREIFSGVFCLFFVFFYFKNTFMWF